MNDGDYIKSTTIRDKVIRHITAESDHRVDSGISGCSGLQVPAWRLEGTRDGLVIETGCRLPWDEVDKMICHIQAIRDRLAQDAIIVGQKV